MRYNEQVNNTTKKKDKKCKDKNKKPGSYTSKDLENAKKIPTKEGYK